jgi:hypothetical protein
VGHRAGIDIEVGSLESRWPETVHAARRFILEGIAGASAVDEPNAEREGVSRTEDPPVLAFPHPVEGGPFRAVPVTRGGTPVATGFTGFLDGTQEVRVINYCTGIPIVWGTVAAAVRARVNRRLVAWSGLGPLVDRRYYLPFRYVTGMRAGLAGHPRVVDTGAEDSTGAVPSRHPAALLERAFQAVQRDRERLERRLAEHWCKTESAALYIDGSITGSSAAACSRLAVGVIKSHRTLYAEGDAFGVVTGLRAGERTTVFRIEPRTRQSVASFYVRTRNPAGRGVLFGLVRIEISESDDVSARADEITRWIISEGAPLALPDARWDRMAYGIRDTEEFLRAIS